MSRLEIVEAVYNLPCDFESDRQRKKRAKILRDLIKLKLHIRNFAKVLNVLGRD